MLEKIIDKQVDRLKNEFNNTDTYLGFNICRENNYVELNIERGKEYLYMDSKKEEDYLKNILSGYIALNDFNTMNDLKNMKIEPILDKNGRYNPSNIINLSNDSQVLLIRFISELFYVKSLKNLSGLDIDSFLTYEKTNYGIKIFGNIPK